VTAFIFVFVFLLIMVGLLISLERYAKHCAENNREVIRYTNWLERAGMRETYSIVVQRWKTPL